MQAKMTLVFTVLLLTLLLSVLFLSFSGSYITQQKKKSNQNLLEENFLLHATVYESVRIGAAFILFLLFLF